MDSTLTRTVPWVLKTTTPVAMGYVPLGIAFGAYAVSLGFPAFVAPLTALVVFAGSMEFLLLGLVSSGAGLLNIALTTLLVNSRHVFYGVSYPWRLLKSPFAKAYGAFALTDETYALINSGVHPTNQRELVLIQAASHVYWVAGATIGALAGTLVPAWFDGFDYALTGLFALLFVGAIRASKERLKIVVSALASIAVGLLLPRDLFLLSTMATYVLICIGLTKFQKARG